MCNSYTYYDVTDTKSHNTITVWQEALPFSRQNVCFCRNFSLGSITSYRSAEERSVSMRRRFRFMTECCSPERAQLRLYGQTGGFNSHALHEDKEKMP